MSQRQHEDGQSESSGSVNYHQGQIEGNEQPNSQFKYNKRPGTTIVGRFYETKLLTLSLTRLLHDEQIKSFYFGNNLDELNPGLGVWSRRTGQQQLFLVVFCI